MPVISVVIGQVAGVLQISVALLVGLGCVLWLLTLRTMRMAGRRSQRDRMLPGN